jgi:Ca-activated chloride channel family protein
MPLTFAHPYVLLLLLVIPLAALLKGRRGQTPAFVYSSVQLLRAVTNITRSKSGGFLMALRWLVLALLITALAQPRLTRFDSTKATASGVDIVVAFDMSFSMTAQDFEIRGQRVDRFTMAREVLKQFIDKRPNDRIGLVVFGSDAYIASPLTLDHDFLLQNLYRLYLRAIDGRQTAIGSGLTTAVNRLRDLKAKSKIIILMTDGQNNAGKVSPMTATEAAQALNIKIYTIGVGKRGDSRRPEEIDEDTLTKIADATHGKYYRADNTEKFKQIYAEIDRLEKTDAEVKKIAFHKELFALLVSVGLALLLIEIALGQTVFRRLP